MAKSNTTLQPWWLEVEGAEEQLIRREITNPWDMVYLNGVLLPGVSKVEISMGHKLDVKQSAGKHFSTITDQGYKPADVIISTTIWTPEQWLLWQTKVLPLIEPDPNGKYSGKPSAFAISHPATLVRGIEGITIETLTGPNPGRGEGTREMKIKALQWSSNFAKSATNTPKSAGVKGFTNAITGAKPSKAAVPAKASK